MNTYLDKIFWRGTDLWSEFAGKTVFVAGATGFYGSWFVDFFTYLQSKGIDLRIEGGSRHAGWDIVDFSTYTDFQRRADFIINCAGYSDANQDEETIWKSHHEGPLILFRSMKLGAKGLQIGTGAIGGESLYAQAKQFAEADLNDIGGLQFVRPFATVGPRMGLDRHFAISTFIRRHLAGQVLEVSNEPITRSFCHIADLVIQMLHVLVNGDGRPYQVGSDSEITIEEAAALISPRVNIVTHPFPTNAASNRYVADLTRIRNQFNLDLEWDSSRAILDTLRYYQSVQT